MEASMRGPGARAVRCGMMLPANQKRNGGLELEQAVAEGVSKDLGEKTPPPRKWALRWSLYFNHRTPLFALPLPAAQEWGGAWGHFFGGVGCIRRVTFQ